MPIAEVRGLGRQVVMAAHLTILMGGGCVMDRFGPAHDYWLGAFWGCAPYRALASVDPQELLMGAKDYCSTPRSGCAAMLGTLLYAAGERDLARWYWSQAEQNMLLFPYHCTLSAGDETYDQRLAGASDVAWPPPSDWRERLRSIESFDDFYSRTMLPSPK